MATKPLRGGGTPCASPKGKIVAFRPNLEAHKIAGPKVGRPLNGGDQNGQPQKVSLQKWAPKIGFREQPRESELGRWLRTIGLSQNDANSVCARVRMIASATTQGPHRSRALEKVVGGALKAGAHGPRV